MWNACYNANKEEKHKTITVRSLRSTYFSMVALSLLCSNICTLYGWLYFELPSVLAKPICTGDNYLYYMVICAFDYHLYYLLQSILPTILGTTVFTLYCHLYSVLLLVLYTAVQPSLDNVLSLPMTIQLQICCNCIGYCMEGTARDVKHLISLNMSPLTVRCFILPKTDDIVQEGFLIGCCGDQIRVISLLPNPVLNPLIRLVPPSVLYIYYHLYSVVPFILPQYSVQFSVLCTTISTLCCDL